MLHPGVSHQNPPCRNGSSQTGKPSGSQVKTFAYFLPSKEHHSHKGTLHKEGNYTFDGQWSSKDIAYKPTVVAPVGTKFKFQYQACSHTHSEIDTKQFHPKLGGTLPELIA